MSTALIDGLTQGVNVGQNNLGQRLLENDMSTKITEKKREKKTFC